METKILKVDPRELELLEVNARFMKADEFQKLVANIKKDGCLTQLPFCCKHPKKKYKLLVLSGNHRVQAAIEAGLEEIEVQCAVKKLSKDEMLGIQLSHNAISGQDDMAILKELYGAIDDIEMRKYAGLDDETLKLLDKITADSISTPSLEYQLLNIVFLPNEIKEIKKALKEFKTEIENTPTLVAHFKDYEDFMETMKDVSEGMLVKNTALTFMLMLRLAKDNIEKTKEVWMEQAKPKDNVPISSIVGRSSIKASDAFELVRAIDLLVARGVIKKNDKVSGLGTLAKYYLENEKKAKDKKKKGKQAGKKV